MSVIVVAVDGPAGSGKSSVSKAAAKILGFSYYDTGAAYRALTFAALHAGADLTDEGAVLGVQKSLEYRASQDPLNQNFFVNGMDVTEAIREPGVSQSVSSVARHALVREALVQHFRDVIRDCEAPGIIMEGRDITTVVAPDAQVRVLLTATEEVRIARRAAELEGIVESPEVGASLAARDRSDQKVVDFMKAAPGVSVVDSTHLSFEDTIQALVDLVNTAKGV